MGVDRILCEIARASLYALIPANLLLGCLMKFRSAFFVATLSLVLSAALALATAAPAAALIHEKIGAGCRVGGFDNEVIPPGQAGASEGNSFVRALQATGIISSIESTPTQVTVNFDLTKPSSKYMSAGFALRIPNGIAPGVDLVLNPLPIPDLGFPAFVHCANLNP
jgi:hypothetical protein